MVECSPSNRFTTFRGVESTCFDSLSDEVATFERLRRAGSHSIVLKTLSMLRQGQRLGHLTIAVFRFSANRSPSRS